VNIKENFNLDIILSRSDYIVYETK